MLVSWETVKAACVVATNRQLIFSSDDRTHYDVCAARTHQYLPEETRDFAEQRDCMGSFPVFGDTAGKCSQTADDDTVSDHRCGLDGKCRWMQHGVCGDYADGKADVVHDRLILSQSAGGKRTDPIDCGQGAQSLPRTDGVEKGGWVQVHGLPMHYNKATGGNPITWEHRFIATMQCDLTQEDCVDPRKRHGGPASDFDWLPAGIGLWKGWRADCVPQSLGDHSSHRGGIPTSAEGWDADCFSAWQKGYHAAFNFASRYIGSKCELVGAYETTWMFVTFWIRLKAPREAYEANGYSGNGMYFRPCYRSPLTSSEQLSTHHAEFSNAKEQACEPGRDPEHYMEHWVCKRPTLSGTSSVTPLVRDDGRCETWCDNNSNDWAAKCAFSNPSCSACPQCSSDNLGGEKPREDCRAFCASSSHASRCDWSDCSGCAQCSPASAQVECDLDCVNVKTAAACERADTRWKMCTAGANWWVSQCKRTCKACDTGLPPCAAGASLLSEEDRSRIGKRVRKHNFLAAQAAALIQKAIVQGHSEIDSDEL